MTCDVRLGRLVGLPAVCGEKVVGHVERAIPDVGDGMLRGLVIRRGLGSAKWADRSAIAVLGDVSVILDARPGRVPRGGSAAWGTVKDEDGLTLGRVTDLWVDPETFAITAMEITLGWMEELRGGRRIIRRWTIRPGRTEAQVLIPRDEWEGGV